MESIFGHRIDGNWVGALRGQWHIPPPPRPGRGALTIWTEILVKNFCQMVLVFFLAPETGTGLSYTI